MEHWNITALSTTYRGTLRNITALSGTLLHYQTLNLIYTTTHNQTQGTLLHYQLLIVEHYPNVTIIRYEQYYAVATLLANQQSKLSESNI